MCDTNPRGAGASLVALVLGGSQGPPWCVCPPGPQGGSCCFPLPSPSLGESIILHVSGSVVLRCQSPSPVSGIFASDLLVGFGLGV